MVVVAIRIVGIPISSLQASATQRKEHTERQAAVRNQTVDEYVIANAASMREKFVPFFELLGEAEPWRGEGACNFYFVTCNA